MSEHRAIPPLAQRIPAEQPATGQARRRPFISPSVQDLGGLALVTLSSSIPVGP
jgi:hypothetical protein